MSGSGAAAGGSAALSVIGGIIGAQGAQMEGQAAAQAAETNAKAMEYRAQYQDQQAKIFLRNRGLALMLGNERALDVRKKNDALLGSIRASYGANGLAMEGSPLDVIEAQAREGSLDVHKELYQADVTAAGFSDAASGATVEATMSRNQAALARYGGATAQVAANYKSAAAMISGLSGAFSSASTTYKAFA